MGREPALVAEIPMLDIRIAEMRMNGRRIENRCRRRGRKRVRQGQICSRRAGFKRLWFLEWRTIANKKQVVSQNRKVIEDTVTASDNRCSLRFGPECES